MKTNDILLFGGIGLGVYLLMQQSKAQASAKGDVGSAIGNAVNSILGRPTTTPGPTSAAASKSPTAQVPDYINASANAINALAKAYGAYANTSSVPGAVIGPGGGSYAPIAYGLDGVPTAYGASALGQRKKPALGQKKPDNYFSAYRFY